MLQFKSYWEHPSFSPDSHRFALVNVVGGGSGWNRSVAVWSTRNWKRVLTRNVAALSPDWRIGVRPQEQGEAWDLVDMTDGATYATVNGAALFDGVVFAPGTGGFVATATADGRVWLWQPAAPDAWGARPNCAGANGTVVAVTLARHLRLAALEFWNGDTSDSCAVVSRPGRSPTPVPSADKLSFSPNGRYLATDDDDYCRSAACRNAGLQLWSGPRWSAAGYPRGGGDGAWSPDGRWLAVWSESTGTGYEGRRFYPTVALYHTGSWKLERIRGTRRSPSTGAAFSADGKLVVSLERGVAVVWTAAGGKVVARLRQPGDPIATAVFAPAGDVVVTTGRRGDAYAWHGRDGASVAALRPPEPVAGVHFSDDGGVVALTARDETRTEIVATRSWRSVASLRGRFQDFTGDGRLVLTRTGDIAAHVWEVESGDQVMQLAPSQSAASGDVVFGGGDRSLVTAGRDGVMRTIPCKSCAPLDELLREAERRVASGPGR